MVLKEKVFKGGGSEVVLKDLEAKEPEELPLIRKIGLLRPERVQLVKWWTRNPYWKNTILLILFLYNKLMQHHHSPPHSPPQQPIQQHHDPFSSPQQQCEASQPKSKPLLLQQQTTPLLAQSEVWDPESSFAPILSLPIIESIPGSMPSFIKT